MKIGPVDSGGRPERPDDDQKRRVPAEPEPRETARPEDSVNISQSGQLLSEQTRSEESSPADIAERFIASADNKKDTTAPSEASQDGTSKATDTELPDLTLRPEDMAVRQDKVEEAKIRIRTGYYNQRDITKDVARRIADDFLG